VLLVGAEDGSIHLHDNVSSGTLLGTIGGGEGEDFINEVCGMVGDDELVVGGGEDGRGRVWSLRSRQIVHTFGGEGGGVRGLR